MRNFLLGIFMTVSLFMTCGMVYLADLLEKEKQRLNLILETGNKLVDLMEKVNQLKNLKKEES